MLSCRYSLSRLLRYAELGSPLESDRQSASIVMFQNITMKSRLFILLAAVLALASCSSTEKPLPAVLRDGEDLENRHSKGSWLPHNS